VTKRHQKGQELFGGHDGERARVCGFGLQLVAPSRKKSRTAGFWRERDVEGEEQIEGVVLSPIGLSALSAEFRKESQANTMFCGAID
jgi:hypothetical protein